MISFAGRGILLDIEGTTSSVHFVYEVMFPFVRRRLDSYLADHWGDSDLRKACDAIAHDAGFGSLAEWLRADESASTSTSSRSEARPPEGSISNRAPESSSQGESRGGQSVGNDDGAAQRLVAAEVTRLMDGDVKATGLKALQGVIWKEGFDSGELKAHVYDDVPVAIRRWTESGRDVRIYSSGSVAAQRLFFGHTIHGDLLPCFSGHYDTTTGPKKSAESYTAIASQFDLPPSEILFISDVVDELNAARHAGFATALAVRPGNAPVADPCGHSSLSTFDDVRFSN